jgi:hypothetical protein
MGQVSQFYGQISGDCQTLIKFLVGIKISSTSGAESSWMGLVRRQAGWPLAAGARRRAILAG